MKGLLGDESGQISGLAYIGVALFVSFFFAGLLYIFFGPQISMILGFVNTWIGLGEVSNNSRQMMFFEYIEWIVFPFVTFIILIMAAVIKSIVSKQYGG